MKILSREEILSAKDFKMEQVPTPEWGEGTAVFVRTMTSAVRDKFELETFNRMERDSSGKTTGKMKTEGLVRAPMCARCACDADGKLLFTEADIQALGEKAPAAMDRIFAVAKRINSFSDQDIKELEGNS